MFNFDFSKESSFQVKLWSVPDQIKVLGFCADIRGRDRGSSENLIDENYLGGARYPISKLQEHWDGIEVPIDIPMMKVNLVADERTFVPNASIDISATEQPGT